MVPPARFRIVPFRSSSRAGVSSKDHAIVVDAVHQIIASNLNRSLSVSKATCRSSVGVPWLNQYLAAGVISRAQYEIVSILPSASSFAATSDTA